MSEPAVGHPPAIDATRRRLLVAFVVASVGALATRPSLGAAATRAPATAADWQAVIEAMFPHPRLDRQLYAVPAGAVVAAADKDPATRELLAAGWASLSAAAGGDFAAAAPAARTAALGTLVGSPLFTILRQTTVFTFYANPTVWEAFGYDGDAWRFGGWLGKGINTIDWLPDPPTRSAP